MVEEREMHIYQKSYPAIGEIMSGGADFFLEKNHQLELTVGCYKGV